LEWTLSRLIYLVLVAQTLWTDEDEHIRRPVGSGIIRRFKGVENAT
jgi:hypothetical protein